ncbi:hypothetical protein VTO73DRAFT_12106 [Trametes versicolor]
MPNNNAYFPILSSSAPSSLILPTRLCPMDNTGDSVSSIFAEAPSTHPDANCPPLIDTLEEPLATCPDTVKSDSTMVSVNNADRSRPAISRLPANVLATIFSLVPGRLQAPGRKRFPFYSISTRMRDLRQLAPIMSTCRDWRELALSTPSLWSTVLWTSDSPGSGGCPLLCTSGPLYVYIAGVTDARALDMFLRTHHHRIQELLWDCSFCDIKACAVLSKIVSEVPFPVLERCGLLDHTLRGDVRTLPILPASPRLQTLQLDAPSYIPSTSFPDLTQLSITSASARSTLGDLIAFLGRNPRLEFLHIVDHTLASSTDVSLEGCRPDRVCLPRLRKFSVKETHAIRLHLRAEGQARISAFQRMLVAHLVIPPSCKIELGVLEVRDLEPITKALFDPAVRATHLYFEGSHPSRFGDVAGWIIRLRNSKDKLDASFSLAHLVRDHMEDPRKIARGAEGAQIDLRAAFACLPVFSGVRYLCIRADTLWGLRSPHSFLPAFGRLESLELSIHSPQEKAHPTVKAILIPLLEVAPGTRAACSSLTTLVVNHLQPRHDGAATESYDKAHRQSGDIKHSSFQKLLAYVKGVVRARAGAGHPLARVVVAQNEAAPSDSASVRIGCKLEYVAPGPWVEVPC